MHQGGMYIPANQRPWRALTVAMAAGIEGHLTYTFPYGEERATQWLAYVVVMNINTSNTRNGCAVCALTNLSRVLINIYVNYSSMFVALLDDIIFDLSVPARVIFPKNTKPNSKPITFEP